MLERLLRVERRVEVREFQLADVLTGELGEFAEARERVQRISEYNWEVRGCGKVAIYRCTYPVRDCWREGEIRSEAGEQQPPGSGALVANDPAR